MQLLRKYRNKPMQESIYNIIPKQRPFSAKEPRYQSKYSPNIPPTGSTFNIKTTSKPGVSNVAGEFKEPPLPHSPYGEAKTLGYLKGQRRAVPSNYRHKHTGTMGDDTLPPKQSFNYDCTYKKEPVPKVGDKPIQGLRSSKNFIVSNAVDNILSVPPMQPKPVDWTKKKNFGKVPEYMNKIKENLEQQNKMRERLRRESSDDRYCLTVGQVQVLQQELRKKWVQVNKQYQSITHIRKIDTIGLKRKKEQCQKQLNELERDIKKLDKIYVFVTQ